jgi:hypothetical protein
LLPMMAYAKLILVNSVTLFQRAQAGPYRKAQSPTVTNCDLCGWVHAPITIVAKEVTVAQHHRNEAI